jgi:hypothetical protein
VRERGFNFDDARLMGGAWRNEPNPDSCKVNHISWLESVTTQFKLDNVFMIPTVMKLSFLEFWAMIWASEILKTA